MKPRQADMADKYGVALDEILEAIAPFDPTAHTQPMTKAEAKAKLSALLRRVEVEAQIKEMTHWASFFEDSSMNAMTPSERLWKRVKQLRALLPRSPQEGEST